MTETKSIVDVQGMKEVGRRRQRGFKVIENRSGQLEMK